MGLFMKAAFTIICFVLISESCFASKDRIITLKEDGQLEGLPLEYNPAILHIQFTSQNEDSASISSISLDLGTNHIIIPICVTGLLNSKRMNEIRLSASWTHDENLFPYSLNVRFFDPGYKSNRSVNNGFMLMFNLHTAKLIRMEVMIVHDGGQSMQSIPVDILDRCAPEERKAFLDDFGRR
jgi:hypothetical protein